MHACLIHVHQTNWTQSTLRELNFSSTLTVKKINSRTQSQIQQGSKKIKKQSQLIIQNNGILTTIAKKSKVDGKLTTNKKHKKGANHNTDNTQITLLEKWDISSPQCKHTAYSKSEIQKYKP
jgi:hypothetical protein